MSSHEDHLGVIYAADLYRHRQHRYESLSIVGVLVKIIKSKSQHRDNLFKLCIVHNFLFISPR